MLRCGRFTCDTITILTFEFQHSVITRIRLKVSGNGLLNKSQLKMDLCQKITELNIDGQILKIKQVPRERTHSPSPDMLMSQKFQDNIILQEEEVECLAIMYVDRPLFKVQSKEEKQYAIELFIRGGPDATLSFQYPPHYPSDVPPTYNLNAPWVREKRLKELYKNLANIFSDNFGRTIMYLWVDEINRILKSEVDYLKKAPQEPPEEPPVEIPLPRRDHIPAIHEGTPIWDRESCFTPYFAKVDSRDEVRRVIEEIEHCRKVSSAWRNTYAYRISAEDGKVDEVGEDGGEPRAGRNLLQRLVNYKADNVLVFISRRFGGRLLGTDRYKHLNAAADEVLVANGYKCSPQGCKDQTTKKKVKEGQTSKKNSKEDEVSKKKPKKNKSKK